MTQAPFFDDIANAPKGGIAHWKTCKDGVRIRVATWKSGTKGTVLIFPGRTEYIEKYGPTIQSFVDRGYSVAAIDWRGQGLAERIAKNRQLGHVKHFHDYQMDVSAMLEVVEEAGLPKPETLLAHSMGGNIALRALHNGLDIKKVIFSAPMWGIYIAPALRVPAKLISTIGPRIGFSQKFSPNTRSENYVQICDFAENKLTNDKETYDWMIRQLDAHPELGIGGPSINWLHQAFLECAKLLMIPTPQQDCLCFLGSNEEIVHPRSLRHIMGKWENAELIDIQGAKHEPLMDGPEILNQVWGNIDRFLAVQ
ncbi:alpha/beta hydrolase [Amylibacter sp. SFDW26]|uniref:alpha/beta fold hydrolase n=1 Tax=Amylibacter sp. SFDW26 TaxID=2652722 RepID=UPI001261B73C|nr:alpha/beta hydrolase [Amylibacter sp. SFDW26]KAB7616208.1 alpha/beta hydrolase [Amylibacter sp. SFDW26]